MKSNAKKSSKEFRHTLKQLAQPNSKFPVAFEAELHRLTQETAYELAEKDGFKESPEHYWFAAKEQVCRTL
jgi:hypothetical protein